MNKISSNIMTGRDKILSAVKASQPETTLLPDIYSFEKNAAGSLEEFVTVLKTVGGLVYHVSNYAEISEILLSVNGGEGKIVSPVKELEVFYNEIILNSTQVTDHHDIDVLIIKGRFAVAENGAIWVTEAEMHKRVLPFICQHLAIIIDAGSIVPTMHEAYNLISESDYGFGTFIAGPSKTADIEQSLVIGAHGPRSMTAFVMNTPNG